MKRLNIRECGRTPTVDTGQRLRPVVTPEVLEESGSALEPWWSCLEVAASHPLWKRELSGSNPRHKTVTTRGTLRVRVDCTHSACTLLVYSHPLTLSPPLTLSLSHSMVTNAQCTAQAHCVTCIPTSRAAVSQKQSSTSPTTYLVESPLRECSQAWARTLWKRDSAVLPRPQKKTHAEDTRQKQTGTLSLSHSLSHSPTLSHSHSLSHSLTLSLFKLKLFLKNSGSCTAHSELLPHLPSVESSRLPCLSSSTTMSCARVFSGAFAGRQLELWLAARPAQRCVGVPRWLGTRVVSGRRLWHRVHVDVMFIGKWTSVCSYVKDCTYPL